MHVEILESTVSDNYFYLIHDGETAVLIDPIDAAVANEAVDASGARLQWVVNTHFHPDHTGGNDAVFERFPDARLCSGPDHQMISGARDVEHVVTHGDVLEAGTLSFDILETPGHTPGHISLRADGHLFSGDTVFVGGAGNCRFGGDAGVLFRTFRDVLSELPGEMVFYPGHDYAVRNIEFALSLRPGHEAANSMLKRAEQHDDGIFLTSLELERGYNPFFCTSEPDLKDALQASHGELWSEQRERSHDDEEATFRSVRALRNNW